MAAARYLEGWESDVGEAVVGRMKLQLLTQLLLQRVAHLLCVAVSLLMQLEGTSIYVIQKFAVSLLKGCARKYVDQSFQSVSPNSLT